MTEGGGLTLSVPPGQKLLVIQVTFISSTCTWDGGRAGPQSADSNAPRFPELFSRTVHCSSDPPRGHGGLLPSRRAQRTCHWPPPNSFSLGSPCPHSLPRLLPTSSTTTRNLLLALSTGLTPDSHWTLEKILAGPMSTWPG